MHLTNLLVGNAFAYTADRLIQLVESTERYSGSEVDSDEEESKSTSTSTKPTAVAAAFNSSSVAPRKHYSTSSSTSSKYVRCSFCKREAKLATRRRVPNSKPVQYIRIVTLINYV